jgi:hypothetical protein
MTAPPEPQPQPQPDPDPEPDHVRDPEAVLAANRKVNEENRTLRQRLKDSEARAKTLEAERDGSKSDVEKAIANARAEARTEVEAHYQAQILTAQIAARAARRFADPDDVVRLLDLEELGGGDMEAIDAALAALAERKPYLLVATTAGNGDQGRWPDADQGSRGEAAGARKESSPDDWLRSITGYGDDA